MVTPTPLWCLAGIQWRPEFTELQVFIVNSTDKAYEDLNLVIRPTIPVVAVEQVSKIPGVSFEDKNNMMTRLVDVPEYGKQESDSFRPSCDRRWLSNAMPEDARAQHYTVRFSLSGC
jgi:hypothetical protein